MSKKLSTIYEDRCMTCDIQTGSNMLYACDISQTYHNQYRKKNIPTSMKKLDV